MSISFRAAERAICRPLLRLAKLADKNPARLATLLGQPARLYNNKSGKKQKVDGGEWAFVGKAICDLSGGATEYAIPCREQRAAKVIRDHLEYLYHLGIPIIPEAAELIRRLQSAATLAIHLRAAEPDWSECLDSVISSSFAAPMDSTDSMDSDLAQMTRSQLQEERLDLEQLPPGADARVGDLLISHPLWSVLQAPFDYSVLLLAADGLTGVTGLRLNQPEGQTLEQLLVASDQELPKSQAWMRKKPVSLGGPVMSYSEGYESLYWIHSKNMDISFCGDLEAMQPSDSLRFFRGCAKWSSDQLSVDLERGFWIHARPQRAQSLHSICFDNVLATRDVWYAAMLAAVGPVLAEFPRGPAADPILKQALVNHYRAQATDIARQLFGPRSAEWERRLEAAKLCKAK